jgi:AcrR family transcriptional regulator
MSTRSRTRATAHAQGARQGGHVGEMQRRRLLHAIGEVVGEGGFEAATVGRICEQAGVSRRTFYELFEDREACLLAACEAHVERLRERALPACERPGRWVERLRDALVLLLEGLDAEPDLARVCVVESLRAGPQLLDYRRRVLEDLARTVDEGRVEAKAGSEPPPLTAQGVVGGALSVIHAHLSASRPLNTGNPATDSPGTNHPKHDRVSSPLIELCGPLMAMIVHPYLGPTPARKELERPVAATQSPTPRGDADPFKGLPIRFTYRTARVLSTIAKDPGASNRHIADSSGISDEGQMSRLLRRLNGCELIENHGEGHAKGEPNAWTLTPRGQAIHTAIAGQGVAR